LLLRSQTQRILIVDRRDQRVAIDTSRSARVAAASGGKAQKRSVAFLKKAALPLF
jgi:hypothetical protein